MAKPKPPTRIDCDRCRHFTGNAFWLRFDCAKGHSEKDPEHNYLLYRKTCSDYSEASRAELIFMRRKSTFAGGEAMKRDALQVKRTATTLRKLTTEESLGQYLTAAELEHFRAAIAALDGLAPDLTRAAKMGDKHREDHHKAWKAKHEEEVQRLVAEALPDATPDVLMAMVEDLRDFCRNWRSTPTTPGGEARGAMVGIYQGDAILRALAACRKASIPANIRALTIELGELIEQMRQADRRNTGGWIDFLEYRRFLAMQRKLVASPSSDSDTSP